MVPRLQGKLSESTLAVDVVICRGEQKDHFVGAFAYCVPARVLSIEPKHGPLTGGTHLKLSTTPFGASITQVSLGGIRCTLVPENVATDSMVVAISPIHSTEGSVSVEVVAENGSRAFVDDAFHYYKV